MPPSLGLRHIEWPCAVDGCTEKWGVLIDMSGRKAERRARLEAKKQKVISEQGNFCLKHKNIARVPSETNRHLSTTYVVVMRRKFGTQMEKALVPVDDPVNGRAEHQTIGPGYYLYLSELPVNARVTFSVDVEIPEEPEEGLVDL